jgi:hypothetical protein
VNGGPASVRCYNLAASKPTVATVRCWPNRDKFSGSSVVALASQECSNSDDCKGAGCADQTFSRGQPTICCKTNENAENHCDPNYQRLRCDKQRRKQTQRGADTESDHCAYSLVHCLIFRRACHHCLCVELIVGPRIAYRKPAARHRQQVADSDLIGSRIADVTALRLGRIINPCSRPGRLAGKAVSCIQPVVGSLDRTRLDKRGGDAGT